MNPQIFGWEHLIFLATFAIFMIVSLILLGIFIKDEKNKVIILKLTAFLLLLFIIWNRISISISNKRWTYLIPDSFCGMSSLVLSLAVLIGKKDNNILHFVFYISIVGGFLTIIYPTFIGRNSSFFYQNTISGLLHHGFSFYLSVMLLIFGWFHPNYQKWLNILIGFMAYINLGTFLITVFGYDDAFYIINPILDGTYLTVWFIGIIFAVIYILFFLIYEIAKRKHMDRIKQNNSEGAKYNND